MVARVVPTTGQIHVNLTTVAGMAIASPVERRLGAARLGFRKEGRLAKQIAVVALNSLSRGAEADPAQSYA